MDERYAARIAERREEILGRMDAALAASGRAREDATLVAVSKTVGVDEVVAAIHAGYRVLARIARRSSTASSRGFPCGPMCPRYASI